jgi:serine phosphatase RsbU (regulator of sigma subunit)
LKGDNKVVNIIEDWDVLAEYAGEKLGFYQLLSNDGIIEIRIQTGRIGFKREFESSSDPLLNKIMDFCKKHRYIQISENMRDDQFFK